MATYTGSSIGFMRQGRNTSTRKDPLTLLSNPAHAFLRNVAGYGESQGIAVISNETDQNDNAIDTTKRDLIRIWATDQNDETSAQIKFILSMIGSMFWRVAAGNDIYLRQIANYEGTSAKRALRWASSFADSFGTSPTAGMDFIDIPDLRLPRLGLTLPNRAMNGLSYGDKNIGCRLHMETAQQRVTVGNGLAFVDSNAFAFPANCIPFAVGVRVQTQPGGTATMDVGIPGTLQLFQIATSTAGGTTANGVAAAWTKIAANTAVRITFNVATTNGNGVIDVLTWYTRPDSAANIGPDSLFSV